MKSIQGSSLILIIYARKGVEMGTSIRTLHGVTSATTVTESTGMAAMSLVKLSLDLVVLIPHVSIF